MNLEDIAYAAEAKVPVPGQGDISVRALSLVDILGLVDRHRVPLQEAFNGLSGRSDDALKSFATMSRAFLSAMPEVAADVVAVGTGQPEKVGVAARLPASLQLAVLEKVAELTFVAEGGMGKTLEIVSQAISGANSAVRHLGRPA